MKILLTIIFLAALIMDSPAQLHISPALQPPQLENFQPLPKPDADFNAAIEALVVESGLDEACPAERNPDGYEEYSSICVVDITDINHPVVGGWRMENFVYPASGYKIYTVAEAVRQALEGEYDFDDRITVKEHNVRTGSRLSAGQEITIAEVLRLTCAYSDNTAANEVIDLVDRQRASLLLRAMGLKGSDITRKYLSRELEDEGYADVPGTLSSAHHFATFYYAVETGAIGGGRGRGIIKGLLATVETNKDRLRAGLPDSASIYTKTGTWNTFSVEAGIVEDGGLKYIICILAPIPSEEANLRIAKFGKGVHELIAARHAK